MILKRIVDAIRTQNWFTVIIEIFIVVIGIFLGLQVSEWNDARKNKIEERRLLSQLSREIDQKIDELNGPNFIALRTQQQQLGEGLLLLQENAPDAITAEQCQALAYSHVMYQPEFNLVTLNEITETKGINFIANPALRQAIIAFRAASKRRADDILFIHGKLIATIDDYPEVFERHLAEDLSGETITCDLAKLQERPVLQTRLKSNFLRTRPFIRRWNQEIDSLRALRDALNEREPNP